MDDYELRMLVASANLKKALTSSSLGTPRSKDAAVQEYLAEQGATGYTVVDAPERPLSQANVARSYVVPTPTQVQRVVKSMEACRGCGMLKASTDECTLCSFKARSARSK